MVLTRSRQIRRRAAILNRHSAPALDSGTLSVGADVWLDAAVLEHYLTSQLVGDGECDCGHLRRTHDGLGVCLATNCVCRDGEYRVDGKPAWEQRAEG